MGFRDLTLNRFYDSDKDDIFNDFYIPTLKEATKFYRLAGYFSSRIFNDIAEGLGIFIENHARAIARTPRFYKTPPNDQPFIHGEGRSGPLDHRNSEKLRKRIPRKLTQE